MPILDLTFLLLQLQMVSGDWVSKPLICQNYEARQVKLAAAAAAVPVAVDEAAVAVVVVQAAEVEVAQ